MTRYYVDWWLGTKNPKVLYRLGDGPADPQYFSKGHGWLRSDTLFARIASGEIDDENIVNEEQARTIIRSWGYAMDGTPI